MNAARNWHGDEPMSNIAKAEMTRARKRALSLFQLLFPVGKTNELLNELNE